jgi:hypothetical protein
MRFLTLLTLSSLCACLPTIAAPAGEEPPPAQTELPAPRALETDSSLVNKFSEGIFITQDIHNTESESRLVTIETVGSDGNETCSSGGAALSTHVSVFDVGGLRAEDFDSGVGLCSKLQFVLGPDEEVTIQVEPNEPDQEGLEVVVRIDFSPVPVGCGV